MDISSKIANQFREVQLNGKWVVGSNFLEQIQDVTWEEANKKIGNHNTIAFLTFHVNYYISGLIKVFEGGDLTIRDKYSFDMKEIKNAEDWNALRSKFKKDAEQFANYVEAMETEEIFAPFVKEQYGDYYINIQSMISHTYYHLGQVILLKKLIREG